MKCPSCNHEVSIPEPEYSCPQIDKAINAVHTMADTVLMEEEIDKVAMMLKRTIREQYSKHIAEVEKELNQVRSENAYLRAFANNFR